MEKGLVGNKLYKKGVFILSTLIPLIVAFLILSPIKHSFSGEWLHYLPGFHALVNSFTVITLLLALWFIKKGNVSRHKTCMYLSFILGCFFLLSYVIYHSGADSVKFGDANHDGILSTFEQQNIGMSRTFYLMLLSSHILCSMGVVPFVLMAFYYALTNNNIKHKKIVKYTFPVWLYVSITGVIVYFMIRPYY